MKTPFVVPCRLANRMADAVSSDALERAQLVDVAMYLGDWLSARDQPGRWDLIDLRAVMVGLASWPRDVQRRALLQMVGLVGFAAFDEQLEPRAAADVLAGVMGLTREESIITLASSTVRKLQGLPPM